MAKYRQIFTKLWSDPFVIELTAEEKLFYLYLISNEKTTQIGVFEVSNITIQTETGLSKEVIEKLLIKFCEYNKILYSADTKEILLLNWLKYNIPNNINAKVCVNREIAHVKNKGFIKILFDKCSAAKLDVDKIFENIIIEENEALELSSNSLLYAPFTGDLQAPYKPMPSNRIRSNKEKVINNKQELINKEEEVVTSNKEILSNSDELKSVIKIFEENVHAITPMVYKKILEFTKHVTSKVIIMAIDEAVNFNAKTMRYISKILDNWISNGLNTVEQVIAYQKQWAGKNKAKLVQTSKPFGFCDYEQRTYDFDLLEKQLLGQV